MLETLNRVPVPPANVPRASRVPLGAREAAKEESGPPYPLSMEAAQVLAILRHPRLAALRTARGFADAADIRADATPDIVLELTAAWTIPDAILAGIASLRWEILTPGTHDARLGLSAAMRRRISSDLEAEEWAVACQARTAWIELAAADRALEAAKRFAEFTREAKVLGDTMVRAGVATEMQLASLELDASSAEQGVAVAEAEIRASRERLSSAVGLPPQTAVRIQSDIDPLTPFEPLIPDGEPAQWLLTRRPELRGARHAYEVAERQLELACLASNIRYQVGPDVFTDTDSYYFGGGVSVIVPSSAKNRADVLDAETRRDQARAEFEERYFTARSRFEIARAEAVAAGSALLLHEGQVMPRARNLLEHSQHALAAGAADLWSVFEARRLAMGAERDAVKLRARYAIAVAELEQTIGPNPPPEDSATRPSEEPR